MKRFFPLIADAFFVECVSCLAAYGNNNLFKVTPPRCLCCWRFRFLSSLSSVRACIQDIGLKAIQSLQYCATQLAGACQMSFVVVAGAMCQSEVRLVHADGRVCTLTPLAGGFVFDDCDLHMSLWFPILTGLAAIINHPHIDVRTGSYLVVVPLVLRCADPLRSTNATQRRSTRCSVCCANMARRSPTRFGGKRLGSLFVVRPPIDSRHFNAYALLPVFRVALCFLAC